MFGPDVTKEWVFVTAQTNVQLQAVASTERLAVSYAQATCSNSNTGDVSVRIGFGTATLPAITNDSLTGLAGLVLSHSGIAKGGGAIAGNGSAAFAIGQYDEDLRLTCSAATGGSLTIIVAYKLLA